MIFLYNDLTPPAKQVGLGFEHFHFSEHEKLQCHQQAKAHTQKKTAIKHTFYNSPNVYILAETVSSIVGIESAAPGRDTVMADAFAQSLSLSSIGVPFNIPAMK